MTRAPLSLREALHCRAPSREGESERDVEQRQGDLPDHSDISAVDRSHSINAGFFMMSAMAITRGK